MTALQRKAAYEAVLRKNKKIIKQSKVLKDLAYMVHTCDVFGMREVSRKINNLVAENIDFDDALSVLENPGCNIDIQCCVGMDLRDMMQVKAAQHISRLFYDAAKVQAEVVAEDIPDEGSIWDWF